MDKEYSITGFSQKGKNRMPYTKVLIHFIWATKNREHLISKELKSLLLQHIKDNSIKKGIFIDTLNYVSDHLHLLVSLGTEQTIAKTAMLIKGVPPERDWVNKQKLIKSRFEWQDEYIGLSVSYSAIDKVRAYISNQEEHHKLKTFAEEYEEFLNAHNFVPLSGMAKASTKLFI